MFCDISTVFLGLLQQRLNKKVNVKYVYIQGSLVNSLNLLGCIFHNLRCLPTFSHYLFLAF